MEFSYEFKGDFDYWNKWIIRYYKSRSANMILSGRTEWEQNDVRVKIRHFEIFRFLSGGDGLSMTIALVKNNEKLWVSLTSSEGIGNISSQLFDVRNKMTEEFKNAFMEEQNMATIEEIPSE